MFSPDATFDDLFKLCKDKLEKVTPSCFCTHEDKENRMKKTKEQEEAIKERLAYLYTFWENEIVIELKRYRSMHCRLLCTTGN